ncbi:uncharacterized protein N7459_002439 [Penicillium hispanicum]|uniref:uncharacterized protein n=1 Tax=Penicillium hispanicum TaxID=1080232 RepID=UPI0025400718|nr:uncharacterized protein N7459_002439 [Penicillium hispanicum]KAJ5586674.1 hypothetical protein N7459_002439 [Penicillium hispanicum]
MQQTFTKRCKDHFVNGDFEYLGPGEEGVDHSRAITVERQAATELSPPDMTLHCYSDTDTRYGCVDDVRLIDLYRESRIFSRMCDGGFKHDNCISLPVSSKYLRQLTDFLWTLDYAVTKGELRKHQVSWNTRHIYCRRCNQHAILLSFHLGVFHTARTLGMELLQLTAMEKLCQAAEGASFKTLSLLAEEVYTTEFPSDADGNRYQLECFEDFRACLVIPAIVNYIRRNRWDPSIPDPELDFQALRSVLPAFDSHLQFELEISSYFKRPSVLPELFSVECTVAEWILGVELGEVWRSAQLPRGGGNSSFNLWSEFTIFPCPTPLIPTKQSLRVEKAADVVKMPGAPWMSAGCATCRSRKVKCDGSQPECARCIKLGVKCPGYQDTLRIVFHQNTLHSNSNTAVSTPGSTSNSADSATNKIRYVGRARPLTLRQAVSSAPATRNQLFAEYMNRFFPVDVAGSIGIDPWYYLMSNFSQLPNKTPMLENAMAAASCVFVGKRCRDNSLLQEGLHLYNRAIHHMSTMISRNAYCDDLVYTAAIFQSLERLHPAHHCPNGIQIWLSHHDGLNALIERCHPRTTRNPLLKAIYDYIELSRALSATIAIGMPPDENQSPMQQPPREDPLGELICTFSGLSPVFKKLASLSNADVQTCQGLHQNCLFYKEQLIAWYARRNAEFGGMPTLASDELCPELAPANHLFGTAYRFPSLDNARLHVLYWTALGLTEHLIYQLSTHSMSRGPNIFHFDPDGQFRALLFYTDEISRAIPYCLQNSMKIWGAHVLIFSAGHICKTYIDAQCWEKFLWCQKVLQRMADFGMECANRMSDVFWKLASEHYRILHSSGGEENTTGTDHSWWEYVKQNAEVTSVEGNPDSRLLR